MYDLTPIIKGVTTMARRTDRATIEIPRYLYDELQTEAAADERTLTSLAVEIIARGLRSRNRPQPGPLMQEIKADLISRGKLKH
jgi:hypothetical protein